MKDECQPDRTADPPCACKIMSLSKATLNQKMSSPNQQRSTSVVLRLPVCESSGGVDRCQMMMILKSLVSHCRLDIISNVPGVPSAMLRQHSFIRQSIMRLSQPPLSAPLMLPPTFLKNSGQQWGG